MDDALRARRSFKALAKNGQVIEIYETLGDFERIAAVVEADLAALDAGERPPGWRTSRVAGRVAFGYCAGTDGVAKLEGHLAAKLTLVCQRCMKPFEWPLEMTLRLQLCEAGVVADEVDGYELWELDEETVSPMEIVDEAIVMALPLSARHETTTCCSVITSVTESDKKVTPFASLKTQIDKAKDKS